MRSDALGASRCTRASNGGRNTISPISDIANVNVVRVASGSKSSSRNPAWTCVSKATRGRHESNRARSRSHASRSANEQRIAHSRAQTTECHADGGLAHREPLRRPRYAAAVVERDRYG